MLESNCQREIQFTFVDSSMRLSIVLALTLMVVVASVAEAKPKAKPLSVKVGLKVNTDGTDGSRQVY